MSRDDLTSESATTRAADWASTLLSLPLIWPKTTLFVSLVAIGMAALATMAPQWRSDKLPPPNARRLEEMMDAVQRADEKIRAGVGSKVQPDPDLRGVFETMRDQPQVSEGSP
jgi:hypothetical protein